MKAGAVIVAAGEGRRMGGGREKLFLQMDGVPLLVLTLRPFQESPAIDEIVLVANRRVKERFEAEFRDGYQFSKVKNLVEGGRRRQDSVYKGLIAFTEPPETVLIHDGDRPFVDRDLIKSVLQKSGRGGAIAAVRAKDTRKLADKDSKIVRTLNRELIWLAQTPQGFPYQTILSAHERARKEEWEVTDDASLVEFSGGKVGIVEGSYDNIKITTAEDWELAKLIYARRKTGMEIWK